jgi:two-component system CheB/CheR fusion protein
MGKKGKKASEIDSNQSNKESQITPQNVEVSTVTPIVAIGASAGGLDAFMTLLQALPAKTGMAIVYIQHLDPHHSSSMVEIFSRVSNLPVLEASDGVLIKEDHVYVIQPATELSIEDGKLLTKPRDSSNGIFMPIDHFMTNLATYMGSNAIGVILSGTASDGTRGLQAIKSSGGVTLVQDPQSARFDGMPKSAIAAGVVDIVLSPEKIATELLKLVQHPFSFNSMVSDEIIFSDEESLSKIIALLLKRSGNDFTHYKASTVKRRIARRMAIHKIEQLNSYLLFIKKHIDELDKLFQDLLINVTNFFRDPESFETLKETVFPKLLENRPTNMPIRIWIPACSQGQEVYSIAIALTEFLTDKGSPVPVAIFGSDIDKQAVDIARAGLYPFEIENEVSQERLKRFFVKNNNGYQISKTIRELCIFAEQNVTKDPPFSRIDLVSCRNLLIYLNSVLQRKVLQILHYALQPNGFLLLGSSESIGSQAGLFFLKDKKSKLYQKKVMAERMDNDFSHHIPLNKIQTDNSQTQVGIKMEKQNLENLVHEMLLEHYSPPGVIVNKDMEILHFHGHTGPYIEPTEGTASFNLMKMARKDLLVELRAGLHNAMKERKIVRRGSIHKSRDGIDHIISILVMPIDAEDSLEPLMLVLFEDQENDEIEPESTQDSGENNRIVELEHELQSTRDYLQSIIEEQEGTNEELRSANEEIQSTNEELQSTNEELETAKEELQSTNEELSTVNEELENRNKELSELNNDLSNLLSNVNLPILMLDNSLKIRQFTPPAEKLLNLIGTDIGRPINNIKPNIDFPDLEEMARDVIENVSHKSIELHDNNDKWFSIRIRPYKTLDNRIDGAVITFVNITDIKDAETRRNALQNEQRLATVIRDATDAITLIGFDGNLLAWNPAASELYGYTETEALNLNIQKLIPDNKYDEFRHIFNRLRAGETFLPFPSQRLTKENKVINVLVNASIIKDNKGKIKAIATTEKEISLDQFNEFEAKV